jgi:drug/metabolite transporter (DMT)-like permease
MTKVATYSSLVGVNVLYACVTLFTKYASQQKFGSAAYCFGLAGAIGVMGAYAVCWQQILKRVELSTAYMFKGTSLIFVMLLAWILFSEQITLNNIIGACVIVIGIVLYAKTDN